jgi:hypothetical protein
VNKFTLPDRAKVAPIQELLQMFNGLKFITSIDLSSAFLQIGLSEKSRQYTAFVFQGQDNQFTRYPYGFRNSLSAFVRALQQTLRPDTSKYALAYVDDIVIHSKTFEDHLKHLNIVLHKLTSAGFTVNAGKCHFCRSEIVFLGYVLSEGGVRPDPQRIQAILSYPAPRNQRQLRQFLGV